MRLSKPRFRQQTAQSKRMGTLSQLCIVLLILLLIFYITVASYLIPSSAKYKHKHPFDDHKDVDNGFIEAPKIPEIDNYVIPKVPDNKVEDKKYVPPHYDPEQEEKYKKLQVIVENEEHAKELERDINDIDSVKAKQEYDSNDVPFINIEENDYSDLEEIENEYRSKCPEKFPKEVPSIDQFPFICSNLKEFDVRHWQMCGLEDCHLCVPPTSKRMQMENDQVCNIYYFFREMIFR